MSRKILSLVLSSLLLFSQTGFAQITGELNLAGYLGQLHYSPIDKLRLPHLRYFSYDNITNNFKLILDKGDSQGIKGEELKDSASALLKYFLIGITLPNESFWVNLRPDSEDNIIDDWLAQTDVGKILLEADLQLKKDTAGFTSPQTPEGKLYWDKLYRKAGELFGSENISIPTLTRPWIVPGEVIIRETEDSAYIYKATLKIMLEEDYLKGDSPLRGQSPYVFSDPRLKVLNEYSSQLIRQLIIPKLTKEVNSAKRYAPLRQVYYSLILARWFKARFYGKGGTYSWAIDKRNLNGLTSQARWSKTTYFKEYKTSFEKGQYNLQVPVAGQYGQNLRSYFSGGVNWIRLAAGSPIEGVFAKTDLVPRLIGNGRNVIAFGIADLTNPLSEIHFEEDQLTTSPQQVTASSPVTASYAQTSPFRAFGQIGQYIWVDGLTLEMLLDGTFEGLVRDHGINGVTTNPTLIKAYLQDARVQEQAAKLAKERDAEGNYKYTQEQIYFLLIKDLALQVINIFKKYNVVGKFSVELDPKNADNLEASVAEAIQWTDVDPECMMVKVPATEAAVKEGGIIEEITAAGRNVNVTLIFTPEQYRRVAQAYIRGLSRAAASGHDLSKIYSVASFFISRWDVKYLSDIPVQHQGWFANAVAIYAYNKIFRAIFQSEEFQALKGARPQDFLLASTGSKAASFAPELRQFYPEDVYVSRVQGANVVNTLPYKTIEYLLTQEIAPEQTIIQHEKLADQVLQETGVNLDEGGAVLLKEGQAAFEKDAATVDGTIAKIISQARSASSPVEKTAASPVEVERFVFDTDSVKIKDWPVILGDDTGIKIWDGPAGKWVQIYNAGGDELLLSLSLSKATNLVTFIPRIKDQLKIIDFIDVELAEAKVFGIEFDRQRRSLQIRVTANTIKQIQGKNLPISGELSNGLSWELVTEFTLSATSSEDSSGAASPVVTVEVNIGEIQWDWKKIFDEAHPSLTEIETFIKNNLPALPVQLKAAIAEDPRNNAYKVQLGELPSGQLVTFSVNLRREKGDNWDNLAATGNFYFGSKLFASLPISVKIISKQGESVSSVNQGAGSPLQQGVGGIDLRNIPFIVQPIGNFAHLSFNMSSSPVALQKINLDEEFRQISLMVERGIVPSGERVKEFILACCYKKELNARIAQLISCLADICRLEEENAQESAPELKESLMLVEAVGASIVTE